MTQQFLPEDVHLTVIPQNAISDMLQPIAYGQEYFCDSGLLSKVP
jgi:hypothetical protein